MTLSQQRLTDLLVGAAEGGSNYWASFSVPKDGCQTGQDYDRVRVREHAKHDDSKPAVDRIVLASELQTGFDRLLTADRKLFPGARQHAADIIAENDDATTADVLMQMTVFGEVIYG